MQPHHQGGQLQPALLGARDEAGQAVWRVADVGVGQPDELGGVLGRRPGHALGERPEFAGPARLQRGALDHLEPGLCAQAPGGLERRLCRAVRALVVDQDHAEGSRIILGQQAANRAGDHVSLVARRHHGGHRGPGRGRRRLAQVVALARQPEPAPSQEQVQPDAESQDADGDREHALEIAFLPEPRERIGQSQGVWPRLISQLAFGLGR